MTDEQTPLKRYLPNMMAAGGKYKNQALLMKDNDFFPFCSSKKQSQDKDKKEDDLNTRIQVRHYLRIRTASAET